MPVPYERTNWNLIGREELKRFVGWSPGPWLIAAAFEWTIIAATIWACNAFNSWWLWLIGFFIIGTRQHALGVLAHDASHHLVAHSLFWNDLLGNFLSAYPLSFTVEGFRTTHLRHHWYLETPADPSKISIEHHPGEWTFPMSKWNFIGMVLRDLTGLSQKSSASLLGYLWEIPGGRRKHIIRLSALHGFFIILCAATGHIWTYVLLWVLPLFTVAVACYRIRSIAEHSGIGPQEERYKRDNVDSLITTRTTVGNPILGFIFAPYNISYHTEHHLYPYVPVFRLNQLHRRLRDNPVYKSKAHITRGYLQLFRELIVSNGESKPTPASSHDPAALR
jgi:fatty acid desaturase